MGLWNYAPSSDEDEDDNEKTVLRNKQENVCPEPCHEMETRKSSRATAAAGTGNKKCLVDLASSDEEGHDKDPNKRAAIDIDLDDIEAEMSAPKKRKKKGSAKGKSPAKGKGKSPGKGKGKSTSKGITCAGTAEKEQEAERLQRIEAVRQKARDAFATDDEEEDDDEDIECSDSPSAPAPIRQSAPAKPSRHLEEEEADIEAQLERERQEMLRNGQAAPGGDTAGVEGEMYVLKVSCKHGSVQIRQGRCANFVTLHDKFRKYAIEHQWATQDTKLRFTCDDEDLDIEEHTPDDFELEDGMVIDVVMN